MTHDSLYIKDNFVCYLRANHVEDENLIDEASTESNLMRIELVRMTQVELNTRKKTVVLKYSKDHELIACLETREELEAFKNDLLAQVPNSQVLNLERTKRHLIRKPLIAIVVLICILFILSLVDPKMNVPNSSMKVEGLMYLLKSLASIGMGKLTFVFAVITIFPAIRIYFRLKYARETKVIQIKGTKT